MKFRKRKFQFCEDVYSPPTKVDIFAAKLHRQNTVLRQKMNNFTLNHVYKSMIASRYLVASRKNATSLEQLSST
jgi:hypothetical protein